MSTDDGKFELVKEPDTADMDRRRLLRFALAREQFRIKDTGKIFSVIDLSSDGFSVRLIDKEDGILFSVGRWIEGMLNLEGEKFNIRAQVKNIRADVVGCEFSKDLPDLSYSALQEYISPAKIGADLKKSPTSPQHNLIWLHGRCGTELFVWVEQKKSEQPLRWILFIAGEFVEWVKDPSHLFTTGRTEFSKDAAQVQGVLRLDTALLIKDPKPNAGRLAVAKQVVLGCNSLSELKSKILVCFGET
jgi:hypothetical protein